MNIAKDVGNSAAIEAHAPRGARLIKPKIEALAFEERKHVVKKRIVVGEFNYRPHRNYEHVRLEAFVVLGQSEWRGGEGSRRRLRFPSTQPHDNIFRVRGFNLVLAFNYLYSPRK